MRKQLKGGYICLYTVYSYIGEIKPTTARHSSIIFSKEVNALMEGHLSSVHLRFQTWQMFAISRRRLGTVVSFTSPAENGLSRGESWYKEEAKKEIYQIDACSYIRQGGKAYIVHTWLHGQKIPFPPSSNKHPQHHHQMETNTSMRLTVFVFFFWGGKRMSW